MDSDEQQIRALVRTWLEASQQGDAETVLGLMSDDVVFLLPGRAPMHKPEFAALARAQAAGDAPRMEGESEIQELQVLGDWAFVRTRLRVVATPAGGPPVERAGHTLTLLRKENGRWLLARDANLLAPVPPPRA